MENIITVDFKAKSIENRKIKLMKYLADYIPELQARHKKLIELRAPKSILDGDTRLIVSYTHRFNRLKAWWRKKNMSPEERLLRIIFGLDELM